MFFIILSVFLVLITINATIWEARGEKGWPLHSLKLLFMSLGLFVVCLIVFA